MVLASPGYLHSWAFLACNSLSPAESVRLRALRYTGLAMSAQRLDSRVLWLNIITFKWSSSRIYKRDIKVTKLHLLADAQIWGSSSLPTHRALSLCRHRGAGKRVDRPCLLQIANSGLQDWARTHLSILQPC